MIRFHLALLIVLTTPSFGWAQLAANAGKSIICEEIGFNEDTGDDLALAKIVIHLGAGGKAVKVDLARPKSSTLPAVKATFTAADSKITHKVEKNDVEYDEVSGEPKLNEETGKPQYKWGIENVETLNAKRGDLSVSIVINDHLYAGRPGSVIAVSKGNKVAVSADQGTVACTGAVVYPMASPEE